MSYCARNVSGAFLDRQTFLHVRYGTERQSVTACRSAMIMDPSRVLRCRGATQTPCHGDEPRRSIASGINNLISCTSEAWTSASTPTLRRLKSAFNPKARTLRRGFHAVPPDKRRARQLQLWHGAVAALVESGNYQLVPLMTIQHCVFGSRDQINGTGRQRETCRDRSSSPRYVPSMLNFNEWKGAGGDT
jgi:hypothetical protein